MEKKFEKLSALKFKPLPLNAKRFIVGGAATFKTVQTGPAQTFDGTETDPDPGPSSFGGEDLRDSQL